MMTKTPRELVYINGSFFKPEEAKISIFDRGFLYGDSIYEVVRTYDGTFFLLDEHIHRLWNSASLLLMTLAFSKEEIKKIIKEAVQESGLSNVYVRVVVTRGEGQIGLDPALSTKNNLVIIVREYPENPSWWYEKGVSVDIVNVIRNDPKSVDPNAKSGNYLNNVMALARAKEAGKFDAIMENKNGMITEGSTSNIWIVEGETLVTPSLDSGILKGITREKIINIAKENGIEVKEELFDKCRLLSSDECFMSSSTKEMIPIIEINDVQIGNGKPGKLTQKMIGLYKDEIKKAHELS